MAQRTLAMIKPDAVSRGDAGKILARYEEEGFRVLACKKTTLSRSEAEAFYGVHSERPFFGDLCDFMTSGPIYAVALERDDAITHLREVMGATNPAEAAEGTIRALYAENIERNSVHGSDAPETAAEELAFHFSGRELL
ncbi:MAG: nucleoside-diphosphate kinase [Acidobacteria bacterium]|nr:nucleoside-diphosphate kinase [Acidobacteriota bacterium]